MIKRSVKINKHLGRYLFLWMAIISFILAVFFENSFLSKHPEESLIRQFEEELHEKELHLDNYLQELSGILLIQGNDGNYLESLHPYNQFLNKEGIGFFVFKQDSLVYWSDQSISFENNYQDSVDSGKLLQLNNGYYIGNTKQEGEYKIIGLILIKKNYTHENEYLKNKFNEGFILPDSYRIINDRLEYSYPILAESGIYLFSVYPLGDVLCTDTQLYIPALFYILGLLFILIYTRKEFVLSEWQLLVKLGILAAILFVIYWLHILFKIPNVFYHLAFSSPDQFSYNIWLPSLGDYFLLALFFFFWAINFNLDFDLKEISRETQIPAKYIASLFFLLCGILFLLADFYIKLLINNSSISFLLNRIIDLSAQSIIGFLSFGMFLLGCFFILVKLVDSSRFIISKRNLVIIVLSVSVFCLFLQYILSSGTSLPILLLYIFYIFFTVFLVRKYIKRLSLSYLVILISATSVYSLVVIYSTNAEREREIQELYAVNLDAQHDPVAELFLAEIQEQLSVDPNITSLLISPYYELEDYLTNTYFSGYFRKYDLQITICKGDQDLNIQPDNDLVPCLPFFDEMIDKDGTQILDTKFYYMDRTNRTITYLGKLDYFSQYEVSTVYIFIELNSTLASVGLGYPELLMDNSMKKPDIYENFTYAKYYEGELIDQYGEDYQYNYYVHSYDFEPAEFSIEKWDDKEHIIYQPREDNFVIVSRDIINFQDYLISFPYIFVFFFLITSIVLLIGNKSIRHRSINFDLKFKVQASIISIVLISLLVVSIGSIFYNISQYETKHQEDLEEKMKSISEEIDLQLFNLNYINEDIQEWLMQYLVDLSNIFRTDINIFGTDGELIASSRQEIYSNGLIATKMNPDAYYELYQNFKNSHFQPEQIGGLSYLSAYQPIINSAGNYIGFINLPYFTRQDKYSQEISTFIVAFINLYVILLLISIAIAFFISNQVSRPLTLIRENLRRIELGKRNEPIDYKGGDEIGSLIKEYNKKVEELAESANILARSERETAWREMAKQIAHEIKNPLTPMKLNIQHLQRTKNSGEHKDEYIERVTNTLIEQIDNLSDIATEFSNFAKIPTAHNQIFNLSESLENVVELYESHDKATVRLDISEADDIEIFADKEQLKRAIINLVRNGIQAIPYGIKGQIKVSLIKDGKNALIKVTDNGIGIPEELQGKLFSPSFTTKSSGMGLGLTIVKSTIENFSGKIWFETEMNKGTIFYIELPVYKG